MLLSIDLPWIPPLRDCCKKPDYKRRVAQDVLSQLTGAGVHNWPEPLQSTRVKIYEPDRRKRSMLSVWEVLQYAIYGLPLYIDSKPVELLWPCIWPGGKITLELSIELKGEKE